MIDGLLLCDKCQNTVKLILTLIAQFVMWYKKKITEQSFKRFICKSPPNTVLNCLLIVTWISTDDYSLIFWFSFGLHGTIVLPHFLWSWASSLTDFGLWHVSGKITVRIHEVSALIRHISFPQHGDCHVSSCGDSIILNKDGIRKPCCHFGDM